MNGDAVVAEESSWNAVVVDGDFDWTVDVDVDLAAVYGLRERVESRRDPAPSKERETDTNIEEEKAISTTDGEEEKGVEGESLQNMEFSLVKHDLVGLATLAAERECTNPEWNISHMENGTIRKLFEKTVSQSSSSTSSLSTCIGLDDFKKGPEELAQDSHFIHRLTPEILVDPAEPFQTLRPSSLGCSYTPNNYGAERRPQTEKPAGEILTFLNDRKALLSMSTDMVLQGLHSFQDEIVRRVLQSEARDEGTHEDISMESDVEVLDSPAVTAAYQLISLSKNGCEKKVCCCNKHGSSLFRTETQFSPSYIVLRNRRERPRRENMLSPTVSISFPMNITTRFDMTLPSNFAKAVPPPGALEEMEKRKIEDPTPPPCVYIERNRYWRDIREFQKLAQLNSGNNWPRFIQERFSVQHPYLPQITSCMYQGNVPISTTRDGLCPYCPEVRFYNFKSSAYASHLMLVHGITTRNYFVPVPLFSAIYTWAEKPPGPGVVCPCCYEIVEASGVKPLTKYLAHYRVHRSALMSMEFEPWGYGYIHKPERSEGL